MADVELFIARGDVDVAGVLPLMNWIRTTSGRTVYIDASGVTFIDSSGLSGLVDAKQELAAEGRTLRIVNRTDAFNLLLELTFMTGTFD